MRNKLRTIPEKSYASAELPKVKFILRCVLLLISLSAIIHEIFAVYAYTFSAPAKSKGSIFLFFFLIGIMFIWDRSQFFSAAIVSVRTRYFWGAILIISSLEMMVYCALFCTGKYADKIHAFAPFNFFQIFMFFIVMMLTLLGEHHLGVINKLKS